MKSGPVRSSAAASNSARGLRGGAAMLGSPDGANASHRVTVKDVARVAGVSQATVSKALNDSRGEVSEETRERVTAVASGLGYRPNAIARSLKARHTHTLGVITNDSDGLFTTAMVRGLAEVASENGFGVFVCNSYDKVAKERQHLELLLDKQVDGIVLIGYKVAERGAPASPTGSTPVVYLYEYTTSVKAPCIVPDDEDGARLAASHVINLGRRRVAFINGPPTYEATRLRLIGYRAALRDGGVAFEPEFVRVAPDWNQDSGFRLALDLMRRSEPPDAIVCANDELAAGAILGLRELGRGVPADVSIIGFDDRPFAAHLPIPLSTIALPLYEMGQRAAEEVFRGLAGEEPRSEIVRVPCKLVVRESCGGRSQS
jgi:LacI family transcriptional regulator, galactose operon repressor